MGTEVESENCNQKGNINGKENVRIKGIFVPFVFSCFPCRRCAVSSIPCFFVEDVLSSLSTVG